MNTKILLATILSLGLFASLAAAVQEVAPSPERGQQTFMRVGCYQCHGTDGQGVHAGRAWTTNAMTRFVRIGSGLMPAYPEEVLSDNEIADIVVFLEAVPSPPSVDSIDVLKDLKVTN
ncbi:MAG: cytochrome c [Bryobacterales bacterium]|nr:cytochrome c [Bryobacterales bacterium]